MRCLQQSIFRCCCCEERGGDRLSCCNTRRFQRVQRAREVRRNDTRPLWPVSCACASKHLLELLFFRSPPCLENTLIFVDDLQMSAKAISTTTPTTGFKKSCTSRRTYAPASIKPSATELERLAVLRLQAELCTPGLDVRESTSERATKTV